MLRLLLPGAGAVLLAGSGCIDLERPPPDRQRYLLEVERPAAEPAAAGGPSLTVRSFHVTIKQPSEGFVYRYADGRVEEDYYHGFFVPPGPVLAETTRRWMRDAGLFAWVDEGGSQLRASHVLEADVLDLHVDLAEPSRPEAVLAMHVVVVPGDGVQPLLQGEYVERVPLSADDAPAAIGAWNEALRRALTRIEADLRDALSGG